MQCTPHIPTTQTAGPANLTAAVLFFGFMLTAPVLLAQTQLGNDQLTAEPATLQVNLWPLKQSTILLLQVQNQARGTAHVTVRDQKGLVLYDACDPKTRFAIPLDVGSMPAGTYTVEVSTWVARQTDTFHIGPMRTGRAISVNEPTLSPVSQTTLTLNQ